MQKVFWFTTPQIIILLFITLSLQSQPLDKTLYLKVDYFKAPSDQIGAYLHVEQELWKPVHQQRLEQGIILGWSFYSLFVGEPDAPYNYIAVNVFDDFEKIDYFGLNNIVAEIYPDKNLSQFYEQTRATREVVRTEIWQINAIVQKDEGNLPIGNYITKNFLDARGGSGEHLELELDFWGGIHRERVEREILNSWALYTLYYPAGDARHYTHSTVEFYDSLGDLTMEADIELAIEVYPDRADKQLNNYFSRTDEARSLYKTEIWKLLDSVGYD